MTADPAEPTVKISVDAAASRGEYFSPCLRNIVMTRKMPVKPANAAAIMAPTE